MIGRLVQMLTEEAEQSILNNTGWLPFPNEKWYVTSERETIIKVSTLVPVVLFGILGNFILLYVISQNRALRTPTNLLIANMALADLLMLLISPWMFLVHDLFQVYQLGNVGCKLEGFLLGAFLITSVLSLCAVSYDRLTAIVFPMEKRLSLNGAKALMFLAWVIGIALALPLSIFRHYNERKWVDFTEKYCYENIKILPLYWHFIIAMLVWIPLAVMFISYSLIFWKLDKYEQQVLKREHPICIRYKKRVVKTLFIILVTFVLLRLPFTSLVFVRSQMLKVGGMNSADGFFCALWYVAHYMLFLNAAINPLIYGLSNDNFRRAYRQTPICCRRHSEKNFGNAKCCKPPVVHYVMSEDLQPRGPCAIDDPDPLAFSNKNKTTKSTKLKPDSPSERKSYATGSDTAEEPKLNHDGYI